MPGHAECVAGRVSLGDGGFVWDIESAQARLGVAALSLHWNMSFHGVAGRSGPFCANAFNLLR